MILLTGSLKSADVLIYKNYMSTDGYIFKAIIKDMTFPRIFRKDI